jgi:copper(I)-binding protein
MRKTILSMLGASVLALTTMQAATASERHHTRMTDRVASAQVRRSNANAAFAEIAAEPEYRGYGGGMSAPAGR